MTPWLLWTLGAALALTGLALTLRALFADRARGRKRCPRCWYDMSGIGEREGGYLCPECGRAVQTVQALRRTRRRWASAIIGLAALIVGAAVAAAPSVAQKRPIDLLPRTALLVFYDQFERDRQDEAYERLIAETPEMWAWQKRRVGVRWVERFLEEMEQLSPVAPPSGAFYASGRMPPTIHPAIESLGADCRLDQRFDDITSLRGEMIRTDQFLIALGASAEPAVDALWSVADPARGEEHSASVRARALALLQRVAPDDERLEPHLTGLVTSGDVAVACLALAMAVEMELDGVDKAMVNRFSEDESALAAFLGPAIPLRERQSLRDRKRVRWIPRWSEPGPEPLRLAIAAFTSAHADKMASHIDRIPTLTLEELLQHASSCSGSELDRSITGALMNAPLEYIAIAARYRGRVIGPPLDTCSPTTIIPPTRESYAEAAELILTLELDELGVRAAHEFMAGDALPKARCTILGGLGEESPLRIGASSVLCRLMLDQSEDQSVRFLAVLMSARLTSDRGRIDQALRQLAELETDTLVHVTARKILGNVEVGP